MTSVCGINDGAKPAGYADGLLVSPELILMAALSGRRAHHLPQRTLPASSHGIPQSDSLPASERRSA